MNPSAGLFLGHWHHPLEGLPGSPLEFYAAVEQAIGRRQLPDTTRSRVDWHEGGAFSAKREYLRITRGRHVLDICGAPFGSGFFVSWWLAEARVNPILPACGALVAIVLLFGIFGRFAPILAPLLFVGLGALMSQGEAEWHGYLLAIPLLGFLWERLFLPPTYYRIDTALMFQEAVHAAVLEAVDGMTDAKGLRRLSELERKPILRDFSRR